MGLALAQNVAPMKSGRSSTITSVPERKQLKTARKGWTLFILKQNMPCVEKNGNLKVEGPTLLAPTMQADCPPVSSGNFSRTDSMISNCNTVDGSIAPSQTKEKLRGLASIVQDVLSRSRSDLRQKYGYKSPIKPPESQPPDHVEDDLPSLDAHVVEIETELVEERNDSAPEMSLSFKMRLVDRCDTDVGVVTSLRNCPASPLFTCDSSQSCRYPLQRPGDGASIADLLERGKRLGIEDNSKLLTPRSSTTDEYECVVKRLKDARGTIRLLAATAIREATRNSPQAREDLWRAGAIPPLVSLLEEEDMGVCYMATVALLNLVIGSNRNKQDMADCGAIPILVRLMRPESTNTVRESATTVIFSLAASDQLKPCIGTSGAIIYLSDILSNGSTQGRSDAVRALLNLSIFKGNRSIIVRAGVVSPLYKVILRDSNESAEKGVILLTHLFLDKEGRETITFDEQTCPVLFQILKRTTFSQSSKEQAVIILLHLSSKTSVRRDAVFAEGILPSVVEIALVGSNPRIQEKAAKLLRIIKEHRTDQGVLSMERESGRRQNGRIPLDRQHSNASTVDSAITTNTAITVDTDTAFTVKSSRRRVTRSASSLSLKEVPQQRKEVKEGKNLSYFRSLMARSLKSEYLPCRAVSVEESNLVPVKLVKSFYSQ